MVGGWRVYYTIGAAESLNSAAFANVAIAAEAIICDVATLYGQLVPVKDVFAVDFSGIEFGLAAAETHGWQFFDIIGDFKQSLTARE